MDETKDTRKDSLPGGKAPEGNEGTTPKVEAKTYTQEELDRAIQGDRTSRGRAAKALELRDQSLTEREKKIREAEAKAEATERETLKDKPDALDIYNQRKALREERANLDRDKAEHAAEIQAAKESEMEQAIFGLAAEFQVDAQAIADGMKDLGLTTVEQARSLAKRLTPKAEAKVETDVKALKTDSGVTSGGGKLTQEQMEKLSMTEYAAERKKQDPKIL